MSLILYVVHVKRAVMHDGEGHTNLITSPLLKDVFLVTMDTYE